ncbi:MAG TPA: IclR family transcriptional regulator [Devosia sp.]|nr:IclR family transcriptional regulator [Devosia sp.]
MEDETTQHSAAAGIALPHPAADMPDAVEAAFGLLEAGLDVLELMNADEPVLSREQIAAVTGLDGALLDRVIGALLARGLIDHAPEADGYMAGVKTLELAYAYQHEAPLVHAANPVLRAISAELDETTMLAVRWDDYRCYIAQVESQRPFRRTIPLGKLKQLYIGAAGKILLGGLTDDELEDYLARVPLESVSATTTTDRDALKRTVARIRETGLAETFSERNLGGASFGAAIRNSEGRITAALIVSIPLVRYRPELRNKIMGSLKQGAEEISDRCFRRQDRGGSGRATPPGRREV